MFPPGFTCPAVLWIQLAAFSYETITLYGVPSHALLLRYRNAVYCPYPEDIATFGLASSVFARHYLRNLG